MRLFKKNETCKIVVDKATNLRVRRFANNHRTKKSKINVHEYGELVTVEFETQETVKELFEKLKNEIGIFFDVELKEGLIFVTEKGATR